MKYSLPRKFHNSYTVASQYFPLFLCTVNITWGILHPQLLINTNRGSEIYLSLTSLAKYGICWKIQTLTSLFFKLILLIIVINCNELSWILRTLPHNEHFMLISTFHSVLETTELSANARNLSYIESVTAYSSVCNTLMRDAMTEIHTFLYAFPASL